MIGIFSEYSGICKVSNALIILYSSRPHFLSQDLVVSVECSVKTKSELVRIIYHILIQEIGISRMLAGIISPDSKTRIHILIIIICDKGDVLRIILVQRNTDLEITVK